MLPPWGTGLVAGAAAAARLPDPRRDDQPAALRPRHRQPPVQGDRLRLRLHVARDGAQARRAPAAAPGPARRRAAPTRTSARSRSSCAGAPTCAASTRRARRRATTASRSGSEREAPSRHGVQANARKRDGLRTRTERDPGTADRGALTARCELHGTQDTDSARRRAGVLLLMRGGRRLRAGLARTRTRSPRASGSAASTSAASTDRGRARPSEPSWSSRSTSRSPSPTRARKYVLSAERARGPRRHRRDGRRGARRRAGGRLPDARLALRDRRRGRPRDRRPQIAYSQDALDDFVDHVAAEIDQRSRATPPSSRPPRRSNPSPARTGVAVLDDEPARASSSTAIDSPASRTVEAPVERGQARGDHRRARREVPHLHHRRPRRLPAAPVREPEAGQEVHGRGRRRRASTPRPALYTIQTSRSTRLERPRLRLGRRPRRAGDPARARTTR